jgi:probable F420-dependent oxidoreductase
VKFTLSVAMCRPAQLTELARTAQECGYAAIALPDSIFYSEKAEAAYPYTPDGSRFWTEQTPWFDPLIAATAMAQVTTTLRFYTQVLKLGPRNPLLLARQVGTVAHLTGNRFGLGVGIGWSPEESQWCGAPFTHRGARMDEAVDVLKLVLSGAMVEYHGKFFDFDKLTMSPLPTEPVPFYVGGHTDAALKRAVRIGDGWTSAMMTLDELRRTIDRLRPEVGDRPFEYQAVCIDRFGVDGYREQRDIGVTDAIVAPWVFYRGMSKPDAIRRFAEEVMARV